MSATRHSSTGTRRRRAHLSDPFVGRKRELAELADALEACRGGLSVLALLVGEAGIGNYVKR